MGLFDTVTNAFSESENSDIWEVISDSSQVDPIIEKSYDRLQLIYKHSHRCSVCFVAKGNLEQASEEILKHADMHYVNVVKNRDASNYIASELEVRHESPQVILLDDEEVIWRGSHGQIESSKILDAF